MNDPLLGPLTPDPQLEGSFAASVDLDGRSISVRLDPEEFGLERCLQLARDVVRALPRVTVTAKTIAAQKLRAEYNRSWREYSRNGPNGLVDVVDPELNEDAFVERLTLVGVAVDGVMIELCFDDGRLFAGHSIFVTSFDGLAFAEVDAMLFG